MVRAWYAFGMSKKWRIVIAILFVVVVAVLYVGFIPADRTIQVPCPSCSTNVTNLNDCAAYFNIVKKTSDFISVAKTFGVTIDNISNISKTVSLTNGLVTCKYYGQPKSLL